MKRHLLASLLQAFALAGAASGETADYPFGKVAMHYLARDSSLPTALVTRFEDDLFTLVLFHGVFEKPMDRRNPGRIRINIDSRGMLQEIDRCGQDSAGTPLPCPRHSGGDMEDFFLDGKAEAGADGRLRLRITIDSIVSTTNAHRKFSKEVLCDTSQSVAGGHPPDCLLDILEDIFRTRWKFLYDESHTDSDLVAIGEIRSDFLDSAARRDLTRHFRALARKGRRYSVQELDLDRTLPEALHSGRISSGGLGVPLHVRFRIAARTKAKYFVATSLDRSDRGRSAFLRSDMIEVETGRAVRHVDALEAYTTGNLEVYRIALAKAAWSLFGTPSASMHRWTLAVPVGIMPRVPRVPLFPSEQASDDRKSAYLDAQRPILKQSSTEPLLNAFSPGLELEYRGFHYLYPFLLLSWVRGANQPRNTGMDRDSRDTIVLESEYIVLDGPSSYRAYTVNSFQTRTLGLGLRMPVWRSRRQTELLLSLQGQWGRMEYRSSWFDSSFSNQTMLLDGEPRGKYQSGLLEASEVRMQGDVWGGGLGAHLRMPMRGRLWSEMAAGFQFQWAERLQGDRVTRGLYFSNNNLEGFKVDPLPTTREKVEMSKGDFVGNGEVYKICPVGGNCKDYRGETIRSRPASELLYLPFFRFALILLI